MVLVELRTWRTTASSVKIPFYKIDATQAQITAALDSFGAVNNQLYNYDNFTSGQLLVDYIFEMRWIMKRVLSGWSAKNTLAFEPAGSYRYQTTNGPDGPPQTWSPGTPDSDNNVTWEGMYSNGSQAPAWMGIAYIQVHPRVDEAFPYLTALSGSQPLGTTIIQTSDDKLMRLTFSNAVNAFGWQCAYVTRGAIPADQFPADISTMLSDLVESNDDEGEDMVRFNPRTATSTVGCYLMTKEQLLEFVRELWDNDITDSIRNAFIGDGSNALLGVKFFYGIRDLIPPSELNSRINMGNVSYTDLPAYPVALKEFIEFDAGSVAVPQFYGDYRDWNATSYSVYLPFVGFVDLKPSDVVGKSLYLKYWINITDGSAVCTLSTTPTTPNGQGTIFTATCSWGYDIPMRVDSVMDVASRTASVLAGLIPGVGGLGNVSSYSVGELSPNSNVMSDFQPKLVVLRREDLSGGEYEEATGLPGAAPVVVGDATGYLKASVVYNAGSLAFRRAGEVIAMINEGIYL